MAELAERLVENRRVLQGIKGDTMQRTSLALRAGQVAKENLERAVASGNDDMLVDALRDAVDTAGREVVSPGTLAAITKLEVQVENMELFLKLNDRARRKGHEGSEAETG
jgi:hypothetical protein